MLEDGAENRWAKDLVQSITDQSRGVCGMLVHTKHHAEHQHQHHLVLGHHDMDIDICMWPRCICVYLRSFAYP